MTSARTILRIVLPLVCVLVGAQSASAAPGAVPPHAFLIPPEVDGPGDACMPELSALAMMEKMAAAMGRHADVLEDAEEDLRSRAADCLDDDDDVTEISAKIWRRAQAPLLKS